MTKSSLLVSVLLLSACAARSKAAAVPVAQGEPAGEGTAARRDDAPPLRVGRGPAGELVMATTHHDAMNGLSVTRKELGASARKTDNSDLVCTRETPTGSHLPEWICRYKSEVEEDRVRTRMMLEKMPKECMAHKCASPE
jgi:hypothetical protein